MDGSDDDSRDGVRVEHRSEGAKDEPSSPPVAVLHLRATARDRAPIGYIPHLAIIRLPPYRNCVRALGEPVCEPTASLKSDVERGGKRWLIHRTTVSDNVSEGRGNRGVHTCMRVTQYYDTLTGSVVLLTVGVRISDACQA